MRHNDPIYYFYRLHLGVWSATARRFITYDAWPLDLTSSQHRIRKISYDFQSLIFLDSDHSLHNQKIHSYHEFNKSGNRCPLGGRKWHWISDDNDSQQSQIRWPCSRFCRFDFALITIYALSKFDSGRPESLWPGSIWSLKSEKIFVILHCDYRTMAITFRIRFIINWLRLLVIFKGMWSSVVNRSWCFRGVDYVHKGISC